MSISKSDKYIKIINKYFGLFGENLAFGYLIFIYCIGKKYKKKYKKNFYNILTFNC